MSTWRMFSDDRNEFRWEIFDQPLQKEGQCDAVPVDARRLPSMADLLLLGSSKLIENGKTIEENTPMFRTGLGKSVELKQSSIAKAHSVLCKIDGYLDGKENGFASLKPKFEMNSLKPANVLHSGLQSAPDNAVNMSNSMFQTGSGKTVSISSAGLLRAKTLLGLEENSDQEHTPKQSTSKNLFALENLSHLETKDLSNLSYNNSTNVLTSSRVKPDFEGSESMNFLDCMNTAIKPPALKFQTAGGRSISVSDDALQRARSLLGNPELDSFLDEASRADLPFSVLDDRKTCSSNQKNDFRSPFLCKGVENSHSSSKTFTSPPTSSSYKKPSFGRTERLCTANNLISQFDAESAVSNSNRPYDGLTESKKPSKSSLYSENMDCLKIAGRPKIDSLKRHSNVALVDISNTMNIDHVDNKQYFGEKRRSQRVSYVTSFKKPRSSFITPLNKKSSSAINVVTRPEPKETSWKQRVSLKYPFLVPRAYLKDYVLRPTSLQEKLEILPDYVKRMNPVTAESYIFQNEILSDCIGPEAFYTLLSQSGASIQYLTKEWVSNHYKWIVWKLASYERCYPSKFAGKLLTVSNVLEELRYRYEREVNHGHKSAIKKILDGDVQPSSMMILCISSVGEKHDSNFGNQSVTLQEGKCGSASQVELTDGWYSVKAQLDEMLSQKLATGKLFLGQKLRIWASKLRGWIGPVSPFEASRTVSLLLHINGTYKCHWAERLGFCKHGGIPLAFGCIKGNGGLVPSTLIGITRVYPVLYKERFSDGSFIVRSERMEAKTLQLFNQRRDVVAEGIMSSFQKETEIDVGHDLESEEGAKLLKLLETSAEPEVLMAGMSSKELASFASYKAKLEAIRQSEMQKTIEKAVEVAGLGERDVTPFFRVKVVGLTYKNPLKKGNSQKGLITIWNPTKKQTLELCEGQAYSVGGLVPSGSDSGMLYLLGSGSSNWAPLPPLAMEKFEPFFTPRSSTAISSLGEIPCSSEFDIVAFVVYVGEVYIQGLQKKQWVFVADGSTDCSTESPDALLAINFSLPCTEFDSSAPVNSNINGSVVGFCNLTKRSRDNVNGLWVAEATENSEYFVSCDQARCNHLKDVGASVLKWANTSSLITQKLKERVDSIISYSKGGS